MFKDAAVFVGLAVFSVAVALGVTALANGTPAELAADNEACARMCETSRVLQCGPVHDKSWPKPKRLAVCLAADGVRAVTE